MRDGDVGRGCRDRGWATGWSKRDVGREDMGWANMGQMQGRDGRQDGARGMWDGGMWDGGTWDRCRDGMGDRMEQVGRGDVGQMQGRDG